MKKVMEILFLFLSVQTFAHDQIVCDVTSRCLKDVYCNDDAYLNYLMVEDVLCVTNTGAKTTYQKEVYHTNERYNNADCAKYRRELIENWKLCK